MSFSNSGQGIWAEQGGSDPIKSHSALSIIAMSSKEVFDCNILGIEMLHSTVNHFGKTS